MLNFCSIDQLVCELGQFCLVCLSLVHCISKMVETVYLKFGIAVPMDFVRVYLK